MCGIVGFVQRDGNISPEEFRRMTDKLAHRGPDASGRRTWSNGNSQIAFGHRRLSIIDVSKQGLQPMSNEDGTIWLIFNGEIYNYRELRSKLISIGHTFKSDSDSETIIHAYETYGIECVKHLRGMFAFALYDQKKNEIFGARDRFGIKPLFYYHDENNFLFASELKAILEKSGINKSLNRHAIDFYFSYGHVGTDKSIYDKIHKVLPGHYFQYDVEKNSFKQTQYWRVQYRHEPTISENEWEKLLYDALSDSVKHHMISDVPLGAFLSGGIDSSSIVGHMAQHSNRPIKTFSIGFEEAAYNELSYAREVAEKFQTDHHELVVGPQSIDILPKLVAAYDEPFADSSAIPTYLVSKFARESVTVALSGDGADELFAGYSLFNRLTAIAKSRVNNVVLRKLFWPLIHRIYPSVMKGKEMINLFGQKSEDFGIYGPSWSVQSRNKIYSTDFISSLKGTTAEGELRSFHVVGADEDFLQSLLHRALRTSMVDGILTKVDRASMQHSLEVRVPILDHHFAELSFGVPSSLKYSGKEEKYIFKQMNRKLIPEANVKRKKQGFNVPLDAWFKNDLYTYYHDVIESQDSQLAEFLNVEEVTRLFNAHKRGGRNQSKYLWRILFFAEWLESRKAQT